MITLEHVQMRFGVTPLFSDLNLAIEDGRHYCLTTPSGSGKTTLLNLLCGLLRPSGGKISVPKGTRFSYVFQEDRLLEHLTATENILLAAHASQEEAEKLLLTTGMTPEDLKKPCSEFSGGMKRRVAILRALLAEWDVLLMDEPYKGLDDCTKEKVLAIVRQYTKGKTVILVTHNTDEAKEYSMLRL